MTKNTTVFGLDRTDSVLVIAPHPDDETLGCGGTIARLTSGGVAVYVLVITVRCSRRWGGTSDPQLRRTELEAACGVLGVADHELAWPDESGSLDITICPRVLVDLIEHEARLSLANVRPSALLIPEASGFHQDHAAVHRAAYAAARRHRVPEAGGKPTPRIVAGYRGPEEAAWSVGLEPWPLYVNTSVFWPRKQDALRCYASQLRGNGHARSLRRIRAIDAGAGAALGWDYAETFAAYRMAYG